MFDKPYRDMTNGMYWPIGREEDYIERPARRDALRVLVDAMERCTMQDMRTAEVREALGYLGECCRQEWPLRRFWDALALPDQQARKQTVRAALATIFRDQPQRQGKD